MNWKTSIAVTIFVTFISTNVFWLLTAVYVFEIVEIGDPEILFGFQAVYKLMEIYGIKAYLNGAYGYFLFALICLIAANFTVRPKTNLKVIISSLGFGLIGAIVYYLFSITVRIQDRVIGTDVALTGFDAFSEIGILNIVVGIISVWIVLSVTILVDLSIKRLIK